MRCLDGHSPKTQSVQHRVTQKRDTQNKTVSEKGICKCGGSAARQESVKYRILCSRTWRTQTGWSKCEHL